MKSPPVVSRRTVLGVSCSALALLGSGSISLDAAADLPALPGDLAWKDPSALKVHNAYTVETLRSALSSGIITPVRRLFLRNNLSSPPSTIMTDPELWTLRVSGVRHPAQLSVAQLKMIGIQALPMVLQCSGNGRRFFTHQPSGTPWATGGAGCVIWGGVAVKDVVNALGGVDPGAQYMTGTGGELIPDNIDPDAVQVERSVPLQTLGSAMLAWELNGEPIPLAHGGPLRLVVPGYYAVNSVKYIKQLAFTTTQSAAAIQQRRYRLSPVGEVGNASQPSAWEMSPKSWVTSPDAGAGSVRAGEVWVQGVAMGGINAVERVEITLDDGRTWQLAAFFGPDLGQYAWRPFALKVELRPGVQRIASRCRDVKGVVQAQDRIENAGGYFNSSWRDHAVELQVI